VEKKKTSLYLSEEDRERLARIAARKGKSQAWVMREALLAYDASEPDKNFELMGGWKYADPNAAAGPSDPQEYHDWLMEGLAEGLNEEYERQIREADGLRG
jgi:hypothetical protein